MGVGGGGGGFQPIIRPNTMGPCLTSHLLRSHSLSLTYAWKSERSELSPPGGIMTVVPAYHTGFVSVEFIGVVLRPHVHKLSV